MGNKKSILKNKFGGVIRSKSASTQPKGSMKNDRINRKLIQNIILIWLDTNIDENNSDCRNTIIQLRYVVNNINTFTDSDQCIQFLEDINDEKACMIISGSLGQQIVPQLHSLSQIDSICIFCSNRNYHEQWAKKWPKIKGVFTTISSLCDAVKKAVHDCEKNATSFSLVAMDGNLSNRDLNQLNPIFMYLQILKEILLDIKFEHQHFVEFIEYCREALEDSENELQNLKEFEQKYRDKTPIWWYTYECFLYPMLNRALRVGDLDVIIKMGFYISDLHRQIKELHKEQFIDKNSENTFTVYRGQCISKDEFKRMQRTIGGLISFNNFLSANREQKGSLDFVLRSFTSSDMVGVLFVMTVNPSKSTIPFASIIDVGCPNVEKDEILFAMQTVFRIQQIEPMADHSDLFRVDLIWTGENDTDLRILMDRIRKEIFPNKDGWERLGLVLQKTGQYDQAQQVYEILLDQQTNENGNVHIYNQLGLIKYEQREYKDSIQYYEKATEILNKVRPRNDPELAKSYNNVATVYDEICQYAKALSYYEKALEIQQKKLSSNHPCLSASYNSIGLANENMGDHSKARSYYELAVNIGQKSLSSNHPHLKIYRKNLDRMKNM